MKKKINPALVIVTPDSPFYKNESFVIGLSFLLPGANISNPTEYMNEYFYGDHIDGVASSGQFHYLPLNPEDHNENFFMRALTSERSDDNSPRAVDDEMKASYAARVNVIDGNTKVDLLINIEAPESINEEIEALEEDLAEFVCRKLCISWEQITLGQAE